MHAASRRRVTFAAGATRKAKHGLGELAVGRARRGHCGAEEDDHETINGAGYILMDRQAPFAAV